MTRIVGVGTTNETHHNTDKIKDAHRLLKGAIHMQLYVKLFGKRHGALGVCSYHAITIHSLSDSQNDILDAVYKYFENVTILNVSVTTEQTLTLEEKMYNTWPGFVAAPHVHKYK